MQYIAVVDCASSGRMYIDDIIEMGYSPLVIYTYIDLERVPEWGPTVEKVKKWVGDKAEYIQMSEETSLDDLLDQLKGYDIACVVPGSESGVRLADKLNKALGLRGNDPDTTYLRCTKEGMYEALKKAGIRYIQSMVVTSEKDVEKFWKDNRLTKAVLKFSENAGTVGLKICDSLEACLEHFRLMQGMYDIKGASDPVIMIQEYIGGTEYVVNSISIDGKHKITGVWRYEKILRDDGTLAYDTMILVDRLVPGIHDILQYDYKVLDAVEMKNGFSHNEIKVDEKGPVLIETNARVMGGTLTREYLDEIFGSHMTDVTLKSLLQPSFFDSYMLTPYRPRKSSIFKFSIVPRDVKADLEPFFELARHLDSFREIVCFGGTGVREYRRTVDLHTCPFFIRMTNEDYGKLKRDYELVRLLEDRYYEMLFIVNDKTEGVPLQTDVDGIMGMLPLSRRFAIVKDDGVTVLQYGKQKAAEGFDIYDGAIFAKCGPSTLTERFRQMMQCMSQIRKGGPVFIVPEAYQSLPYGAVAAETVMSIMGFSEGIPPSTGNGMLYGIKR